MTGFTFLRQAPSLPPTWTSFLLMPAAMIVLLFFEANVFLLCALTVKLNYLKGKYTVAPTLNNAYLPKDWVMC